MRVLGSVAWSAIVSLGLALAAGCVNQIQQPLDGEGLGPEGDSAVFLGDAVVFDDGAGLDDGAGAPGDECGGTPGDETGGDALVSGDEPLGGDELPAGDAPTAGDAHMAGDELSSGDQAPASAGDGDEADGDALAGDSSAGGDWAPCNDGYTDAGEECDVGGLACAAIDTWAFDPQCNCACRYNWYCGDLTVQWPDEECDDGNAGRWDGCYQCQDTDLHVNKSGSSSTIGDQTSAAVAAWPDWTSAVAWQTPTGQVWAALYGPDYQLLVPHFRVDSSGFSQRQPAIARLGPDRLAIVWSAEAAMVRNVYGRVLTLTDSDSDGLFDGSSAGPRFMVNACDNGNDHQLPAIAAWADGAFVVVDRAYASCATGGAAPQGYDIEAWLFDASGARIGSSFRLANEATAGHQTDPTVATWQSPSPGFIVAWADDNDGDHGSIRALRALRDASAPGYSAWGTPTTFEPSSAGASACPSSICSGHRGPALATRPDGYVVAAWDALDATTGRNVYLQAYQPGAAVTLAGDQLVVNVSSSGVQEAPAVTAWGAGGRVAVFWHGDSGSGVGSDVLSRTLVCGLGGCAPESGEHLVNEYLTSTQRTSAAAVAEDGPESDGAVVAWESFAQDDELDYGVFSTRLRWSR